MKIIVRKFIEDDFQGLARCIESLVQHLSEMDEWDSIFVPDEGYGERYAKTLLSQVGDDGAVFVAIEGEKVVGAIMGALEREEEKVTNGQWKLWGRVLALYTDDAYRGQGVGKKLLGRMEEYFRIKQCEVVLIEIFSPNIAAKEFYEKNQYEEITRDLVKKLN